MIYCVLEGPKGAGKSTALERLRTGLRDHRVAFREVHPTRAGHPLHPLELAARLPRLRDLDRFRERLYAYRSNHHAGRVDWHAAHPPLVLGDRSIITSLVTRWQRTQQLGVDGHVHAVRRLEGRIPLPDHVFYLDLPLDVLLDRLAERRPRRAYGRAHEERAHLEQNHRAYAELTTRPPSGLEGLRWHQIDATLPPPAVAAQVLSTILTLLEVHHAAAR